MTIREYIRNQLLPPLKRFPTSVQDALIEIITWRLEELYDLTIRFPEIITPDKSRTDILQAIVEQFNFTIREEADLTEQIRILENIIEVYNKRGSIDSIENMWRYYGGDLPKNVKVTIPSQNLFRYSVSSWSGKHVFQDNRINRAGSYEINLVNSTYDHEKLKDFLLEELVTAGTTVYFKNSLALDTLDTLKYNYLVDFHMYKYINMYLYSTADKLKVSLERNLYNKDGDLINSNYPGYFILNHSILGEEVV